LLLALLSLPEEELPEDDLEDGDDDLDAGEDEPDGDDDADADDEDIDDADNDPELEPENDADDDRFRLCSAAASVVAAAAAAVAVAPAEEPTTPSLLLPTLLPPSVAEVRLKGTKTSSPQSAISTFAKGLLVLGSTSWFSTSCTTDMPSTTHPTTTCFPSKWGAGLRTVSVSTEARTEEG